MDDELKHGQRRPVIIKISLEELKKRGRVGNIGDVKPEEEKIAGGHSICLQESSGLSCRRWIRIV